VTSKLFIILAIGALAFVSNAIAAEKLPRALENINPAETRRISDEEAKEIKAGPGYAQYLAEQGMRQKNALTRPGQIAIRPGR
jgi:hypothetical protein